MKHVPWHVKGVRPDAREVARDAARRSGLSVGEWLNSLIVDSAAHQHSSAGPYREPARPDRHFRPAHDGDARFAAIRKDIDELKGQIDRLAQGTAPPVAPSSRREGLRGTPFAESNARIERKLEGLNRNGEPSQGGPGRNFEVDDALAEIAARQQFLDAESADTQPYDTPAADHEMARPQLDPSMIEQQLRDIAAHVKALQNPSRFDSMAAEISRTIERAAPRQAIEAIAEQLRRLTAQLESVRPSASADQLADSLRRDVAEIGRRINDAMPQRAVASIAEQIRALSDQVASLQQPPRAEDIAEALRRNFAEFRASFGDAPPAQPMDLTSIEEQVRALTGAVAQLHPRLRVEDVADALRHDLDEMGAALTNAIPHRAVASIEEQIQALNVQISKLHAPPIDEIANMLRHDLVEIGAVLHDAMPTSAIAALEQEVRALGERLGTHRDPPVEGPGTAGFEHALAGIHDRLRALTPAEDLAELSHAVKSLSRKADAIVPDSTAPEMLHQLEHAIGALHDLASQVASRDAVAGLSRDIHMLGDKIDHSSRQAADPDIMTALEQRLAEVAEAVGRSRSVESSAIPANFDAVIKTLADRLEATEIPAVDHDALRSLEQRIITLVDKLEQSEDRLGRQELGRQELDRQDIGRHEDADRGMTELLAQLKELRAQNEYKLQAIQQQLVASAAEAISGPAEAIRRDVATLKEIQTLADRRTQDTFEAVYGTIEQVVDRLASIEEGLRDTRHGEPTAALRELPGEPAAPQMLSNAPAIVPPAAPLADRAELPGKAAFGTSSAKPAATAPQARQPIVSDLPPDAPLEPGSGARRVRVVANAIDRIAASEAVNAAAKPAEAETAAPARANFVAAARRAALAVASEQEGSPSARPDKAIQDPQQKAQPGKLLQKLGPRIKSVVLGISVIMLVLGALRLALDLFYNAESPSAPPVTRMDDAVQPGGESIPPASPPPLEPPRSGKGAGLESPTLSGPRSATIFPGEATLAQMPTSGVLADLAAPAAAPRPAVARAAAAIPATAAAPPDTIGSLPTGSLPVRNPLLQGPASRDAAPAAPARDLTREPLPPTIGGKALISAAAAGEPGASYEVATRFAEGRNVPQDLAMAAAWFDRAARSGLAPAQFRLGSMYEKGLGIKKDLPEARRLYLAATDKGNAKAMHNLAVLYAEGLEGKPDYAVASQWFRKAAAYGVVDSQYNLAILYARGVGIERNAAESYKWFALAAKGGDKDAAKKRDEIATRLDPQQLESAKQAVEGFVAEPQPNEATATKAPAGGWDQVAAAAPAKSKSGR